LRVPEDLGVIGFDHSPESAYYHPPLTTIRHRLAEQGKIAVQQLVQMIETKQKNRIADPSEITVLQPKLVVRKSTMMIADPEKDNFNDETLGN
jgi:LacI family transcriptional regulator